MKSEIEQLGPCKVKIKVEIPTDEIRGKIEEKYKEVRQTVVIPGFRKGHVPRNILEKRFGKSIEEDAKMDLISGAYSKTVEEKKIAAVGEPDIPMETIEMTPEKPMAFELTVETKPEIKPKDYAGVEAKKKKAVVTDEELAKALERLAEARSEWLPVDKAAADDMVIADLTLTEGEKSVVAEPNQHIVVAKDIEVLHTPAPQVFEALLGAASGDVRTAEVTAPADHKDESLRGKKMAFTAKIKEVKRLKKPVIDDAWAKEMDYESLDKVKDEIRRRLAEEKGLQADHEVEEQVVDALLKKHEIPLPETLLTTYAARAEERARLQLQMKGVPDAEVDAIIEKERASSKDEMEKLLRTHFLLEAIGQKERIFVTEDEVEARVDRMAAQYRRMPGEVREMLEARGQMTELRSTLREEKIRKFLREKAKITEADE